jgi:DNA-binding NtrC family response regulator
MYSVLVVDDEKNIRQGLVTAFKGAGYRTLAAEDGREALDIIKRYDIDLVVSDLKMPKLAGDALIKEALAVRPLLKVIVITGHGTVETAVEMMRQGAYDFLTKPVNLDHLFLVAQRALQTKSLQLEQANLKEALKKHREGILSDFTGKSVAMQRVYQILQQAAPAKAAIMILGESGVGKEVAADVIHALSPRRDKPLIKVNCAALSEQLLESELFGHEKGAFTGALYQRKGRFELADGGDIFLDEIGELSQGVQVKLLRVLQEKTFERVGGEESLKVDIRLITATNRDLKKEVEAGRFREDLFYRLNVVQVVIPPLRERREDIMPLARRFLNDFCEENGKPIEGFTAAAVRALQAYSWPGNVRELRNCIENAVVMCRSANIDAVDLPISTHSEESSDELRLPLNIILAEAEKRYISAVLKKEGGNKSRTAKILGISRKTLQRKTGVNDEH